MKTIWNLVGILIAIGLIYHGFKVIDTGVVLFAPDRGGVIFHAGEYSLPAGFFLICMGFLFLYLSIRTKKS